MPPKRFQRIEKTWDEYWAEYWRIRLVQEDEVVAWKNQQVVDFSTKMLDIKPGMRILDLGCGAGFQANLFAENGILVHGIDISPPLIKHAAAIAKKKKLSATFAVGNMHDFTVKEPYDRVLILGMSFGFGTDEENEATLRNVFTAVKPGGQILLTGQHPYSASTHTGPEWVETNDGFLVHHGEFDPITCRLGGMWELVRPDGTVITEGDNPESDGIRCYSVPELARMLLDVGFNHPRFFGSWMLPPTELQWFSTEMITVAERPALASASKTKRVRKV
ncbi:class I SAM-dependent methyltransferase [candidate division KSB1 bacterium]|nr:MAG: class I SAM-dependent methyltransferase [candidate division KSB1 bacterium]